MRTSVIVVAMIGVAGWGAVEGQPRWETSERTDGQAEFRLHNDEGAAIIIGCRLEGVYVRFEFAEELDNPQRAAVRTVPGERQNVAVTQVSDRVVNVTSGSGISDTFRLLRTGSRLNVRVAGQQAWFDVFGSDSVVSECLEMQEALPEG